jgi:hypothetical protein
MLERDRKTGIVRDILLELRDLCGEYGLSQDVAKTTYDIADQAVQRHGEIVVMRFAT